MREIVELRIDEEQAHYLLDRDEGKKCGSVRILRVLSMDRRVATIADLQRRANLNGTSFVWGFEISRKYTPSELDSAEWLHLIPTRYLMTSGEECATKYDSSGCPLCGWGDNQLTP